jgi:hypothetical protein
MKTLVIDQPIKATINSQEMYFEVKQTPSKILPFMGMSREASVDESLTTEIVSGETVSIDGSNYRARVVGAVMDGIHFTLIRD